MQTKAFTLEELASLPSMLCLSSRFIAVLYALVAYCLSRSPLWPGALGAFLGSFVVDMLRVSFSRKA